MIYSPICCCGHEHSLHLNVSDDVNRLSASSANKWNEDKDTEAVATDAFGDVSFGGRNHSKVMHWNFISYFKTPIKLYENYEMFLENFLC